jgi:hypothetical protein
MPRALAAAATALLLAATMAPALAAEAPLAETYRAYAERLRSSPFHRPLLIESSESKNAVAGDVYALLPNTLAEVSSALGDASNWCALLILHPNVAQCRPQPGAAGASLAISFARSFDQKEADADRAVLQFHAERGAGRFVVALDGDEGPVGTGDYRFRLEAASVEGGKTFAHLRYGYSYGFLARMAMQAYLSGKGSRKVGFTITGSGPDGPQYIGGLRGSIERNIMRYYLAIESWLAASAAPPEERFGRSLDHWLDAIEDYPRQLRESDRAAYAQAKREAHQAQQG